MHDRQLELELGIKREIRARNLRKSRSARGHEWFERMRQLVEQAPDRQIGRDETQRETPPLLAKAA
jgi:hypothetical protein